MRQAFKVVVALGIPAVLAAMVLAQGQGGFFGMMGGGGPSTLIANSGVQKELRLTDEQKDQLKTLREDVQKDTMELFRGLPKGDFQAMGEATKKQAALNKEAMEKAAAMLNASQKAAWKELAGEAFEYKMEFGGKP